MSTLFNLKPQIQYKQSSRHPWENTIKNENCNKIKHAHNSINNPCYPEKKAAVPDEDRVTFTVVGDRLTKAFIYCKTLVNGLHKYRWKKFGVPVIRGVTTVEWPEVLRALKIQHGGIAYCIQSSVAVLVNDKILGGEQELKELVETKYIYHLKLDYYNETVKQFALFVRCSGRPCAYMHISIDGEHVGTMMFMLYSDVLPNTCENFLRLCKETKGGYSGTPVHRIVKDGWIQCGGFGLKSSELDCENFIIPHDRRGVLCMANDGRHIDCSTQFFVLLQPAPWMAQKYVAFGQLIEGAGTLDKIEKVPTWYESPQAKIIIYKSGIFNMECQDIVINKGTNEYIHGHIEDLNALGELLMETLMVRVFLEIELKLVQRLEKELLQEEEIKTEGGEGAIHATKRFIRKKEDNDKQFQSHTNTRQSIKSQSSRDGQRQNDNNDFDVEEYELEETPYQHQSLASHSLVVKTQRPFYIPLTDVPYPGEVDSTYDLKKLLKGDYCLESDLDPNAPKDPSKAKEKSYCMDFISINKDKSESVSYASLDSEDEREIQQYYKMNVDQTSFAGDVVKSIGRGYGNSNLTKNEIRSQLINDETLRRIRITAEEHREAQNKKVSISVQETEKGVPSKIKRRQTGFVRPEDFKKIHRPEKATSSDNEDVEDDIPKAVRIAPTTFTNSPGPHIIRRSTGFARTGEFDLSDIDMDARNAKPSAMQRLYDDVSYITNGPTLKDYKPKSESQPKHMLLTISGHTRIRSEESNKEKFLRHSMNKDQYSLENVLNLQHGKKLARKISSDYVRPKGDGGDKFGVSIRSIEYAKTRPAMTVSEYQLKNMKYQEEIKDKEEAAKENLDRGKSDESNQRAIQLPEDSPAYSETSFV